MISARALHNRVPFERILVVHVVEHQLLKVGGARRKYSRPSFLDLVIDDEFAILNLAINPGVVELCEIQVLPSPNLVSGIKPGDPKPDAAGLIFEESELCV